MPTATWLRPSGPVIFSRGVCRHEISQCVQLTLPEDAVLLDPRCSHMHLLGLQPAAIHSAVSRASHEPGVLKYTEVLRYRWSGHIERVCQLAHGRLANREPRQDGSASRVAQRRKGQVKSIFNRNHLVTILL